MIDLWELTRRPYVLPPAKTQWELAKEFYQNKHPDVEVTHTIMQQEALPEYVEWAFGVFVKDYTSSLDQAIIFEFISQFMFAYLNLEIPFREAGMFRSQLHYELRKYRDLLLYGADEYKDLFNATTNLTRTETHTHTFEEAGKRDGKNTSSHTDTTGVKGSTSNTEEGSTSGTQSGKQTSSSTQDSTANIKSTGSSTSTQTNDLTAENNTTNTSKGTSTNKQDINNDVHTSGTNNSKGRQINTDYPQTSLELTLVAPTDDTWKYASTGGDQVNNSTNASDTITEGSVSTNQSDDRTDTSTGTTTNTGTVETEGSTTGNQDTTGKATSSGEIASEGNTAGTHSTTATGTSQSDTTSNGERTDITDETDSRNGSSSDDIKADWDTISQFDRIKLILDYIRDNPYSPIYRVIDILVDLFNGVYPDQERWGYIDPDTDLTKLLVGGER